MGNIYGYVRVSSIDQNEDRQLIVMDENNVPQNGLIIKLSFPNLQNITKNYCNSRRIVVKFMSYK